MLDNVFLEVCNMGFTASYVIVFIQITRLLIIKAPKIFSYSLWSVVLFRLLCPVSFESIFSAFTLAGKTTQDIRPFPETFYSVSNVGTANEVAIDTVPLKILENFSTIVEPLFSTVLTLIWLIGIAVMSIYSLIQIIKLRKKLITAIPLKDNIYLADHITSPFVMGVIKPKIYLPSGLSEHEQDFIIAHEKHHIKRCDHITRIIAFIALTLHWFNPFVWFAFILSGKDMELSCDEAVIKKMDKDIRVEYSSSLLRFTTGRKLISATPLAFGEGDTKGRIENVMKYKKPVVWVSIIALIVVLCVAVGFMSNPKGTINLLDAETIILSEDTIDGMPSIAMISNGENNIIPTEEIPNVKNFIKTIEINKSEIISSSIEVQESAHTIQLLSEGTYPIDINFNSDFSEVWVNDYVKSSFSYFVETPMVEMITFFNEYTANVFFVKPPSLKADMSTGEAVFLDYADDDKIVFHGYFGLFVYDLKKEQITLAVDLEQAVGSNVIQDPESVAVVVDGDGENIMLWSHEMKTQTDILYSNAMYINIDTGSYRVKENDGFEISTPHTNVHSTYLTTGSIGKIKYTRDNKEWLLFNDFPFDTSADNMDEEMGVPSNGVINHVVDGIVVSETVNKTLADAIIMSGLVISAAFDGVNIDTLDEYYYINYGIHDCYAYLLDGEAVLQLGKDGSYVGISHEFYKALIDQFTPNDLLINLGNTDKIQVILAGGNPTYGFKIKIITDEIEISEFVDAFDNFTVNEDDTLDIDIVPPSYYRFYDEDELVEEFMFNGNDTTAMWIGQYIKLIEYDGKTPFELYENSKSYETISYQDPDFAKGLDTHIIDLNATTSEEIANEIQAKYKKAKAEFEEQVWTNSELP